ncbi:efflux RND transporter periplasmic adaptor subunit [Pelotomaculum propionicicum]|uniref:efflux RND transporter periplasmic adaptor subunit n=1 Tax=Pelotomaculum propionicicum TaxID=258475 RepID=UPI003B8212C2
MKHRWKLWLAPLAVILALGLWKGGGFLKQKEDSSPVERAQTVAVHEVGKVKIEEAVALTGSLEALHDGVVSSKVPGRVSRVLVENGAVVTAGQPLVLLEDTEYANALAIARATLKKAEANLDSARINYERFRELYQSNVISEKEFEDVQTMLKIAEADAAAAAAAASSAEESLRGATVVSPFNGVVSNRNVTPGQMAAAGTPLMNVEDISSVYVVVNVEQKDLGRVKTGLPADVNVDSFVSRGFEGVVEIINPSANNNARVFETKIKVANGEGLLKPGMFASVRIKTGEEGEALAVPQNSLVSIQGMYFAYVADGDRALRRQVEIGQVVGQLVEIKSGLTAGQKIVVTNINVLKDQDKIIISE